MRTIVLLALGLCAVGPASSIGEVQAQPQSAPPVARPAVPVASPPVEPPHAALPPALPVLVKSQQSAYVPAQPSQRPAWHFHDGERQSLQDQYLRLTEKRTERMNRPELEQGIAELRRQNLIAELSNLANNSPDSFGKLRSKVAVAVLNANDQKELVTLIHSMAAELAPVEKKDEEDEEVGQREIAPQRLLGNLIDLNGQHRSYLLAVARLLSP